MKLHGIFPPITTPLERDRCAPERLADNIAAYQRHGVAGYVVLGSTGEAPLLEVEEKVAVLRAARSAIPSRQPLIAGVGLQSTAATISLAQRAADEGADLLLVLTPFYFRSRMGEEALVRHFAAVADASPVPLLLYSVPKFTGLDLPVSAVVRLAHHPGIVGLKDSSGDLAWMGEVRGRVPPEFTILCGAASVFADALAAGADGGILAAADVLTEPFVEIFARSVDGDGAAAVALQQRVKAASELLVSALGVAGVKAAMDERGLFGGAPRPPLLSSSAQERTTIRHTLEGLVAAGLLPRLLL